MRMSLFSGFFPVFFAVRICAAQDSSVDGPTALRVLCYNIHHGEGTDGSVDLVRLGRRIRSVSPDLVALQEVDDRTRRTGTIDQTSELAKLTGLTGRFAHQIDYEGGRYGQAILSRYPVSEITVHWLPGMPDRERRIAGAVSIDLGTQKVAFVTTHLHHNNEPFRKAQAAALNEIFAESDSFRNTAVILTGDLNAVPSSEPIAILRKHWISATSEEGQYLTFPATSPQKQLDYLMFRPQHRFRIRAVQILDEPIVSDHRPLIIDLEVSAR